MNPNDRRDDWQQGVDANLAGLNTGQRSQDDKLEKLEESQEEIQCIIHGETDSGLIGRIEKLESDSVRLNAVIFQDAAGKKGLHHDIQMLLDGREDRRDRWGNLTKIFVAVITSGALGLFWRDIRSYFMRPPQDPVEQMIDRAKHPKSKHRHETIREEDLKPEAERD